MSNGDTTGSLDLCVVEGDVPMFHVDFKKCLCHVSFPPCSMSMLKNAHVPCRYLLRAHVGGGGGPCVACRLYKKW